MWGGSFECRGGESGAVVMLVRAVAVLTERHRWDELPDTGCSTNLQGREVQVVVN